jgi:cytoskeletal protein CcmA (bactofilin family)
MPASKQDKVQVACPHCGHLQAEPRTAFSTVCKKCHGHFRLQEVLRPAPKSKERVPELKHVTCFECGTELEVPASAQSTMCKRCSRYMDLKDYLIDKAASKNFKTKGTFTIELSGYVFNTEIVAGDVILKGRLLGKIAAENTLTIYSTAEIKGSFKTHRLVIPAANRFAWKDTITLFSAEIAGDLAANLRAGGTVTLKSTARVFGDIEARGLVVESGAVLVGNLRIETPKVEAPAPKPIPIPAPKPEIEVIVETAPVEEIQPELGVTMRSEPPKKTRAAPKEEDAPASKIAPRKAPVRRTRQK